MIDKITFDRASRASSRCSWCCLLLVLLALAIGSVVWYLLKERAAALSLVSAPPTPAPSVSIPAPSVSISTPSVSIPAPSVSISTPSVSISAPSVSTRSIPLPTGPQINLNNANFTIDVPRDQPEIRVCVRDHSCEDGDRVRLLINDTEVYKGEIYTTPSCVLASIYAGENNLELYAINGTGGKGNCSYEPINTGQIIIQNINWESAQWGLSPGGSSFAKVNVVLK